MGRRAGYNTEQIISETDSAMTVANGDRNACAETLKIDIDALHRRIARHLPLRAKWGGWRPKDAPNEAVAISRPVVVGTKEIDTANQMLIEDNKVKAGLSNLALSEAELKMAFGFQAFQRRMFTNALDLLGGGITKQFISLCTEIDSISNRLSVGVGLDGEKLTPTMEAILREDRAKLLAIQVSMYDRASKAALTAIQVRNLMNAKGGSDGKKNDKPGFAMLVKATGDVHLHEHK